MCSLPAIHSNINFFSNQSWWKVCLNYLKTWFHQINKPLVNFSKLFLFITLSPCVHMCSWVKCLFPSIFILCWFFFPTAVSSAISVGSATVAVIFVCIILVLLLSILVFMWKKLSGKNSTKDVEVSIQNGWCGFDKTFTKYLWALIYH